MSRMGTYDATNGFVPFDDAPKKQTNADRTYCVSPDCKDKCGRHISNCDAEPCELVSVADLSGVCRAYIRQIVKEVENG